MKKILVASSNEGKIKELNKLFDDLEVEFVSLKEVEGLSHLEEPEETASTYKENALIKARYYAAHCDLPTLADDSGIECLALSKWPGVHSARIGSSNEERRDVLITRLKDENVDQPWEARFVCVLCFLHEGQEHFFEGQCEGEVQEEAVGNKGFGYDPIFLMPDGRTLGEYLAQEKNAVSHRGKAVRAFREFLGNLSLQDD